MANIRVSSASKPGSVAGAIASRLKQEGNVRVEAVGAAAVNQAVKAVAIARGFVVQSGMDISAVPYFGQTDIDGQDRTSIVFSVEIKQ